MNILITGIGGFVGGHLSEQLLKQTDHQITGTTFFPTDRYQHLKEKGIGLEQVDLTDEDRVYRLLEQTRPDQIYHLAAQSFVPESFSNPWNTLGNNIHAQLNLLHSMVKLNLNARILVVGSSEEYGPVPEQDNPINEDQPLRPANPYSVSKVTQDMLGLQYFQSHNVPVIRVRPFNHIGPGQSDRFVASAFASQIAAIEQSRQEPTMYVGNLNAKRDFTDVRDMVRAYQVIMEQGQVGEVYNIGSGKARSIQELLDTLLYLTNKPIEIQSDPARMRPVTVPLIECDAGKIRKLTGWEPTITFKQTLADILEDWRGRDL